MLLVQNTAGQILYAHQSLEPVTCRTCGDEIRPGWYFTQWPTVDLATQQTVLYSCCTVCYPVYLPKTDPYHTEPMQPVHTDDQPTLIMPAVHRASTPPPPSFKERVRRKLKKFSLVQ